MLDYVYLNIDEIMNGHSAIGVWVVFSKPTPPLFINVCNTPGIMLGIKKKHSGSNILWNPIFNAYYKCQCNLTSFLFLFKKVSSQTLHHTQVISRNYWWNSPSFLIVGTLSRISIKRWLSRGQDLKKNPGGLITYQNHKYDLDANDARPRGGKMSRSLFRDDRRRKQSGA